MSLSTYPGATSIYPNLPRRQLQCPAFCERITAAFVAPYKLRPAAIPILPATDEMFNDVCAILEIGQGSLIIQNSPFRFVSSIASSFWTEVDRAESAPKTPALFTRICSASCEAFKHRVDIFRHPKSAFSKRDCPEISRPDRLRGGFRFDGSGADLRSRVRKLQRDGTTMPRELRDQRSLSFQQAHGLPLYVQIILLDGTGSVTVKQGASAGAGGSFYIARVAAQNRFKNAQAQACSAPRPLSRVERVEDVGQDLTECRDHHPEKIAETEWFLSPKPNSRSVPRSARRAWPVPHSESSSEKPA